MNKILIVDDDKAICRTLELHFVENGYEVDVAHSITVGLAACQKKQPQIIILDIRLGGKSGLEGLPEFKRLIPDVRVIIITAYHDMDSTIEAMKKGADDYIHKPIDIDEIDSAIKNALIYSKPDNNELHIAPRAFSDSKRNVIIGQSRSMKEIFKVIGLVATTSTTVLITGESGTGKELVAKAIHQASTVSKGPFIAINCAALVESLLESDMFGHVKGAFTGAVSKQIGKFSMANNGTIFLDELTELSQTMQAKLLRVLQEKEYTPIGGKNIETTNARVIAATNKDLKKALKNGDFREDLYYRLKVVNINIPPLRERREDIPRLVEALLVRINKEINKNVNRISPDVLQCFEQYDWPGNIRELENTLMKSVALCPGHIISRNLLSDNIKLCLPEEDIELNYAPKKLESLQDIEKIHIFKVLTNTNWHRGNACKILGISRPRLRRLIALFELTPPEWIELKHNDEENIENQIEDMD